MDIKRGIWLFLVFLFSAKLLITGTFVFSADRNGKSMEMKKLFPLKIGSYQSDGKDEFYDRQTTFRYMDGVAELYRSYGFKLLMVRRYAKADPPPIIVETFDMSSSEDAFGVFSYETGDEDVEIGQGPDFGGGLLRFWKGKFFVNAYMPESSTSKTIKIENGRWTTAQFHQKHVIVIFDAPSKEKGEVLTQATIKNLREGK